MKLRTLAAPGLAAVVMFSAAGCGDDDSGNSGKHDVSDDIREWDACEIFNNLESMIEFLDIESLGGETGGTDGPENLPVTEGEDMASAVCFGSADFEAIDPGESDSGQGGEIEGIVLTRVAPYEENDNAAGWFESDLDKLLRAAGAGNPEGTVDEEDVIQLSVEGDWDEGEYVHYETETEAYYDVVFRDGNLLMGVTVTHVKVDGDPLDFTSEDVEDWLVNDYVAEVHEAVLDHVS